MNKRTEPDRLDNVFRLQEQLMLRYKALGTTNMPDWPVDMSVKKNQQACREAGLKSVEELLEPIS